MFLGVTVASHNACPLSRFGSPPIFLLTGRSDFSERPKSIDADKEITGNGHHFGQRSQAMIAARRGILETDPQRIIETADGAQLRTDAKEVFSMWIQFLSGFIRGKWSGDIVFFAI